MPKDRRNFFKQHPDPMWIYDVGSLRILDVNDAAVFHYGYDRDEFLSLTIADIRPAEDVPALMENLRQGVVGHEGAGLWRHRLKSGEIIEVTIRSNGLEFEGRPARLVVAHDVTSVMAAERKANALLRLAGHAAHLGGWRYDPKARDVEWSGEAAQVLDLCRSDPPTIRKVSAGLTNPSGPGFATLVRRCLQRGEAFDAVFRNQRRPEGARWVRLIGAPEHGPDGAIRAVIGSVQDVTEAEHRREELRRSEERFRLVAQAADNVVWDYDYVQGTMWCTDNLESIFGHAPDSCTPNLSSWKTRVHPEDLERVERGLAAALHSDARVWKDEYRYFRADGSVARVVERGYIIRDAEGRPMRLVGTMMDVTKEREIEARALRSQRLEALGQLTGGIAHDFNNLLTVILGNAELLTEPRPEQERRVMAEAIVRSAERGAALTSHLLAYARRQPLVSRPIDLNTLVGGFQALLGRTLPGTIELDLLPCPKLRLAELDPNQAEAALLNLAINARDAMPDGGRLTIETANARIEKHEVDRFGDVAPGDYVRLTVRDTGTGMSRETAERVFDPFFTTKGEGKGSGLGLAMVYGFVQQSSGHISVSSEPGAGSAFDLYFPCIPHGRESTLTAPESTEPVGGDAHILVVEDDDQVRAQVVRQMTGLGYKVTEAGDGQAALDCFKRTPGIDLVFTDVMMPGGMDGPQLAAAVLHLRPQTKILFTSGYPGDVIARTGLPERAIPLLGKPYRLQDLAAQVRVVLED